MLAAQELGIEFHIAGNWTGYSNPADKRTDEKKYGIKIHQIDFIRTPYDPRNIKAYRQVVELVKREKFDVIHCNTPIGGVVGRLAGKKCGVKKIIYQVHGFHFYKGAPKKNWLIYYTIEKFLARFTDCIIAINSEDYATAKRFRLKKGGKIYKVHGVGIDLQEFAKMANIRDVKRKKLRFIEEDIVIISVGELNANKNNSVIINALSKIKNPHVHYILCGIGEEREKLQKMIKEYNMDEDVHFLGYRSDVKELYAASDIFVMPSFREGLSRSIMEAMAVGLPCIVSRIRGNVDLIEDGKGGYLCDPHDADAFVKAINMCTADTRKKMGTHNLEEIKKYDISVVKLEIKKIYKDILG